MKIGIRTPSFKKSLKAMTTGKIKRKIKKAIIPGYGKKGMGWITNPKKALYNKVYNATTVDVTKIVEKAIVHNFCTKCGGKLSTGHKYCTKCGNKI